MRILRHSRSDYGLGSLTEILKTLEVVLYSLGSVLVHEQWFLFTNKSRCTCRVKFILHRRLRDSFSFTRDYHCLAQAEEYRKWELHTLSLSRYLTVTLSRSPSLPDRATHSAPVRPRLYRERPCQAKRHSRASSKMHSLVNSLRIITCPTEASNPRAGPPPTI